MGGKIVGERDLQPRAAPTSAASSPPSSARSRTASTSPATTTTSGVIARQARELGITAKLMGGDGWDSEKLFELGGAAVEGSYFSNHYSPDDPNPRIQKFIADYKAAYGAVPDALAALGYDAAMVAVDAMKRAATLDRHRGPRRHRRDQELPRGDRHHHPRRASATPPSPRWSSRSARARPSTWPPSPPDVRLRAAPHQRARRRHHLRPGGPGLHDGLRGAEAHQLRPRRRDDGRHVPRLRGGPEAGAGASVLALGRAAHLPGGDGRLRDHRLRSSSGSPTGRCETSRGSPRSSPPSASPSPCPTGSSSTSARCPALRRGPFRRSSLRASG